MAANRFREPLMKRQFMPDADGRGERRRWRTRRGFPNLPRKKQASIHREQKRKRAQAAGR